MQITGNTILITGGGSGIGQALASALHARGNQVIVTGRRREALEATVAAHPGMAYELLDVTDADAIRAFAERIVVAWPALNVLINNAGVMIAEDLTDDPVDLAVAEATVSTNILGPIRLTAALLPHLRAQGKASVVTVTSGLAYVPLVATPTYSASKAFIRSYTQSLRRQLQDTSVEVLELAPPAVATDLMPGHAENPNSMPLADYIDEVMGVLEAGNTDDIFVQRTRFFSEAAREGRYDQVFEAINSH